MERRGRPGHPTAATLRALLSGREPRRGVTQQAGPGTAAPQCRFLPSSLPARAAPAAGCSAPGSAAPRSRGCCRPAAGRGAGQSRTAASPESLRSEKTSPIARPIPTPPRRCPHRLPGQPCRRSAALSESKRSLRSNPEPLPAAPPRLSATRGPPAARLRGAEPGAKSEGSAGPAPTAGRLRAPQRGGRAFTPHGARREAGTAGPRLPAPPRSRPPPPQPRAGPNRAARRPRGPRTAPPPPAPRQPPRSPRRRRRRRRRGSRSRGWRSAWRGRGRGTGERGGVCARRYRPRSAAISGPALRGAAPRGPRDGAAREPPRSAPRSDGPPRSAAARRPPAGRGRCERAEGGGRGRWVSWRSGRRRAVSASRAGRAGRPRAGESLTSPPFQVRAPERPRRCRW